MNTRFVFLLLCALLAGCESAPRGSRARAYVKPGLIMVPVDQAHYYGVGGQPPDGIPPEPPDGYKATDVRSVQTDAPVTAIHFNRYADPSRPSELMHEAHIVYRREGGPRWRLHPVSKEHQILVGPRLTDGRSEVKPLASQELDSYLREQRTNVQKQQQVIGQVTEGMQQLAEQQQQLAKDLGKLRELQTTSKPPQPTIPPAPDAPAPSGQAADSLTHP